MEPMIADDSAWVKIAALNTSTFDVTQDITKTGIYPSSLLMELTVSILFLKVVTTINVYMKAGD